MICSFNVLYSNVISLAFALFQGLLIVLCLIFVGGGVRADAEIQLLDFDHLLQLTQVQPITGCSRKKSSILPPPRSDGLAVLWCHLRKTFFDYFVLYLFTRARI